MFEFCLNCNQTILILQVGNRDDSNVYVGMKIKTASEVYKLFCKFNSFFTTAIKHKYHSGKSKSPLFFFILKVPNLVAFKIICKELGSYTKINDCDTIHLNAFTFPLNV